MRWKIQLGNQYMFTDIETMFIDATNGEIAGLARYMKDDSTPVR